jgi:hypothetical protein
MRRKTKTAIFVFFCFVKHYNQPANAITMEYQVINTNIFVLPLNLRLQVVVSY